MSHEQFVHSYLVSQAIQFMVCSIAVGYQYDLLRRDRRQWADQDRAGRRNFSEESRYSGTSKS